MKNRPVILLLILAGLAGCGKENRTISPSPVLASVPTPSPSLTPLPSPTPLGVVKWYTGSLRLEGDRVVGTIHNNTDKQQPASLCLYSKPGGFIFVDGTESTVDSNQSTTLSLRNAYLLKRCFEVELKAVGCSVPPTPDILAASIVLGEGCGPDPQPTPTPTPRPTPTPTPTPSPTPTPCHDVGTATLTATYKSGSGYSLKDGGTLLWSGSLTKDVPFQVTPLEPNGHTLKFYYNSELLASAGASCVQASWTGKLKFSCTCR